MFGYYAIGMGIIVGLIANHFITKWLGRVLSSKN